MEESYKLKVNHEIDWKPIKQYVDGLFLQMREQIERQQDEIKKQQVQIAMLQEDNKQLKGIIEGGQTRNDQKNTLGFNLQINKQAWEASGSCLVYV